MPNQQKRAPERSKVQRSGRTVTDAEVLTQEHDELAIALRSSIVSVCDWLFGLTQEQLNALELQHRKDGLELLTSKIERLKQLLSSGFQYKPWMYEARARANPTLAGAHPSETVLAAARRALQILNKLKATAATTQLDLYDVSLVRVEQATLQAQLTETTQRNFEAKAIDVGYVDLLVKYVEPPQSLEAMLLLNRQKVPLGELKDFTDEESLLKELAQVTDETVLGYSQRRGHTYTALFTVRAGRSWTLMEAIQEMRNLAKSDQGRFDARVVLVARDISDAYRALIEHEGFHALDEADLAQMHGSR